MHSEEIKKNINEALDLIEWLHDQLNDLFIPEPQQISCTLYYIAIQHAEGALLLLDLRREGPAFALARTIYEHFMRGLWFSVKATSEQRVDAIKNDRFPNLGVIVDTFKNQNEIGVVKLYDQIRILHSYTHGGIHQIYNHLNSETLESNFEPENIKALIDTCLRLAVASAIQMATLLSNTEAHNKITHRVDSMFNLDIPNN